MPSRCRYSIVKSVGWLIALLSGSLSLQAHALSNQCLEYLPDNITVASEVRICTSTFNGDYNRYSCQDYNAGDEHYRILYRGGLIPKAILKFDEANRKHVVWSPLFGDQEIHCPLAPPDGIPYRAKHRGIGVCQDDNDEYVPCSIYEHAAPRKIEAYRYFAMYDPSGEQPATIDTLVTGKNVDALVAEFSFQIGISLLKTDCCKQQAFEYIQHAYSMFPRADAYRRAYYRTKATLAASE